MAAGFHCDRMVFDQAAVGWTRRKKNVRTAAPSRRSLMSGLRPATAGGTWRAGTASRFILRRTGRADARRAAFGYANVAKSMPTSAGHSLITKCAERHPGGRNSLNRADDRTCHVMARGIRTGAAQQRPASGIPTCWLFVTDPITRRLRSKTICQTHHDQHRATRSRGWCNPVYRASSPGSGRTL